jgi:hypothetical protein
MRTCPLRRQQPLHVVRRKVLLVVIQREVHHPHTGVTGARVDEPPVGEVRYLFAVYSGM